MHKNLYPNKKKCKIFLHHVLVLFTVNYLRHKKFLNLKNEKQNSYC